MIAEYDLTEYMEVYSVDIVDTVIAFLNAIGGRILIGIRDDGTVKGVDEPDSVRLRCIQNLDLISPEASAMVDVVVIRKCGVSLVVVDVREGIHKPYHLRSVGKRAEGVFVRTGSESLPSTEEQFDLMVRCAGVNRFEELESHCQDLTFEYLGMRFGSEGISLDRERMESLNMVVSGRYTNLAFMLSDQYDVPVIPTAFADAFERTVIDCKVIKGSVLEQYDRATGSVCRNDVCSLYTSVPEWILRDAVSNAIIHRDYGSPASVLISVTPSRMVVTSPGGLETSFTDDELFRGVSSVRNRNLVEVFSLLGVVKNHGTGLPRIASAYRFLDVSPYTITGENSFTLVLPVPDAYIEDRVREFVESHTDFTRLQMQNALGMNKSEAVGIVNRLLSDGIITRAGNGRSTRYRYDVSS